MKYIDDFLNNITMYRLVLYFLIILACVGLAFSILGALPFDAISYLFSFTFILFVCYVSNKIFATIFEAPTNVESVWISGLILGLIVAPPKNLHDVIFLGWASLLSMAGKFILAIGKKHIFNPVALSVAVTAFAINGSAIWWVGTISMLPIVAVGGFLIVRKIKRWSLVLSFVGVAIVTIFIFGILKGTDIVSLMQRTIIDTPLIFFATIMLTEPMTTPPTTSLQLIYGAIVGFLFAPQIHVGTFYTTPELALILGNVFSYLVSPNKKFVLKLKERIRLSPDIYDFVFTPPVEFNYKPGSYMEWTYSHEKPDSRGNRRYLTLASSPTESDVRIGIKFNNPPSSYKRSLFDIGKNGKVIVASQLSGEFLLPTDPQQKLVFVAGGIGVTPFRSMIKYLLDKGEKRDIVLIYSAKLPEDLVYRDVFDTASRQVGLKTIYTVTSPDDSWKGRVGHIDSDFIQKEIPDYRQRTFFLSGPRSMVTGFEETLRSLNLPRGQIKTDYFPGFA